MNRNFMLQRYGCIQSWYNAKNTWAIPSVQASAMVSYTQNINAVK